jgi:hypothetical protein
MTWKRRISRYVRYVAVIVLLGGGGGAPGIAQMAQGQEPKVTIAGGVRTDNPQYFDWTITNEYSSPIVKIEIPHTNGDLLEAPSGWGYKWLKGAEAPAELGQTVCRATAKEPNFGIAAGRGMKFSMRVNREGALPRTGTVRITFEDGKATIVTGVQLPSGQQTIERGVVTITLGAVFAIVLIVHARRRKRAESAAAADKHA